MAWTGRAGRARSMASRVSFDAQSGCPRCSSFRGPWERVEGRHWEDRSADSIAAWAERGIVGRGILVDYHSWRLAQTDPKYGSFDAFKRTIIPLDDLKACLKAQATEVKFGDILFVRSGTSDSSVLLMPLYLDHLVYLKPTYPPFQRH